MKIINFNCGFYNVVFDSPEGKYSSFSCGMSLVLFVNRILFKRKLVSQFKIISEPQSHHLKAIYNTQYFFHCTNAVKRINTCGNPHKSALPAHPFLILSLSSYYK